MATAIRGNCIGKSGETAGDIWRLLNDAGPMPLTRVTKEVKAVRDVVMRTDGWLARGARYRSTKKATERLLAGSTGDAALGQMQTTKN